MALNFGIAFSRESVANISGPQFEQEPTKVKYISYGLTSANEETVYTVPAGKRFYLGKFIFINFSGATVLCRFLIGTEKIWHGNVDNNYSREIDFYIPLLVNAGVEIRAETDTSNSIVVIIGWLE